jgi:hypothetical protein
MISGGVQPGKWLLTKSWNVEPTLSALEALLSPSKEWPYVRLCESQENFWLEPVHVDQLSTEEGRSRCFRESFSSVDLIHYLVTNHLKTHCPEVMAVSLVGLLEPQMRLKKIVVNPPLRRSVSTEFGRLTIKANVHPTREKMPSYPQVKRLGNLIIMELKGKKKLPVSDGPFVIGHLPDGTPLRAGGSKSAFRLFEKKRREI